MSTPKRHHFVPDFLIRNFCVQENKAFWLRKNANLQTPSLMASDKVFVERHSNTFEASDGTKAYTVERQLGTLEGPTKLIFDQIKSSASLEKLPGLNLAQRGTLGEFVLTLYKRSPTIRKKYSSLHLVQEIVAESFLELDDRGMTIDDEMRKRLSSEDWAKRTGKEITVKATLAHGDIALPLLAAKGIYVAQPQSPKKSFILGSFPLLMLKGELSNGIKDALSECWLPISPTVALCLYGSANNEELRRLSDEHMRYLNRLIWLQSESAIANSPQLLKSLAFDR